MTEPNEPAYPVQDCSNQQYPGLSKRELFAKDFLAAEIAHGGLYGLVDEDKCKAISLADALLAELAKEATQ